MSVINILPREVFELIAAGEVVERPASAVKELIENSIDAGATKITVEINSGGIKYIRISDNGCGIERADVPKAFISHATSKIRTGADLDTILTMGFRGEALASIAAVAHVEMLTKTSGEAIGTHYVIEGGTELLCDDAGCPDGTTITITGLFFNTPARMKFLKKDMTEGSYVSDVISKAALSHPGISFRLIKDGKQTLFTTGDGKPSNAVSAVLGKEFADNLIACDYSLGGISVSGFICKPLACRPNRNMQYFFVNGRSVRIPTASAALDEAYKNSAMVGKFPSCVLNLQIAPETVDVNVHPAKTEIRFSNEKKVFEAVYYAAKSAIERFDTRPEFSFKSMPIKSDEPHRTEQFFIHETTAQFKARQDDEPEKQTSENLFPGASYTAQPEKYDTQSASYTAKASDVSADYTASDDEFDDIPLSALMPKPKKPEPEPVVTIITEQKKPDEIRIIGEAFKTYIICEYGNKLLLVDKHAMHERMIYDELKSSAKTQSQMIIPVTVRLSSQEYTAVLENTELLSEAGFAVDDFGEGTVIVRECPYALSSEDASSLIAELGGYLAKNVTNPINAKLDWLFHNTACRAAVKAGKDLHPEEMKALIERFCREDVRYCPHGRPVLIEMTRYEIEKQFGRIQ